MMYGAEIWGWKKRKELEKIQGKYIKWTLRLDRNTPEYIILNETRRDKLIIKTGKRALRYEDKISKEEDSILGECWRIQKLGKKEKSQENKIEFLMERGWSLEEYLKRKEKGETVWPELELIGRDIQKQKAEAKIKDSKYAREVKDILLKETGREYLRTKNGIRKDELSIMARYRMGNESKACKYWLKEEDRKCRLCGEKEET